MDNTEEFYTKSPKISKRRCLVIAKRGYTQEEVERYFKEHGCVLLDTYKNCKIKVKYKCKCGDINFITFDNFKQGRRCKKCGIKKMADVQKLDINYVRQVFIDNGCLPLFQTYKNGHTPLKYRCECGEIGHTAFFDFKGGKRCGHCRVQRIQKTMYKNGTQQCSSQQKHIHNLIGGKLNYPYGKSSLDIAFPEDKIYIEYDGSGHDLSVKIGSMSQEEFNKREVRRRYALYRRGWKEMTIVSRKDYFPKDFKIIEMINEGKDFLKEESWIKYDIDLKKVINKYGEYLYDFGELYRYRV